MRAIPRIVISVVLALGVLAGCASEESTSPDPERPGETILAPHGLAGLDGRELVDRMDAMPITERPEGLIASVRADEVLVGNANGEEASIPLTGDEFYVSIAPYVNQTHDCFYHSLTTCLGELRNADVQVQVTDDAGNTLVDEQLRTFDNGFVGLWLPRDMTGTITVEHEGRSVTAPLSTTADAATCVTTLQLA